MKMSFTTLAGLTGLYEALVSTCSTVLAWATCAPAATRRTVTKQRNKRCVILLPMGPLFQAPAGPLRAFSATLYVPNGDW